MELMRESPPARFKWHDATFLVKTRATGYDKSQIALSANGKIVSEGGREVVYYDKVAFFTLLARLFVVGWEGVLRDGKPAPYSCDLLLSAFPADPERDLLIELGGFILEHVDMFKTDHDLKKESPARSSGSRAETSLAAAGKTA